MAVIVTSECVEEHYPSVCLFYVVAEISIERCVGAISPWRGYADAVPAVAHFVEVDFSAVFPVGEQCGIGFGWISGDYSSGSAIEFGRIGQNRGIGTCCENGNSCEEKQLGDVFHDCGFRLRDYTGKYNVFWGFLQIFAVFF
ncbi:MAG: hypothetical protein K2L76_06225 [Muribaculaceae bacterium]|nr:hypothetical protein [Muribaculaceae bacterium]